MSSIRIQKANIDTLYTALTTLLVFFIPLSTTLTQVIMGLIALTWVLSGNLKEKITLTFEYPVTRAACFLFLIFLVGLAYTSAPWNEAIAQLKKMSKLLYFVCLTPLFAESNRRKNAIWAFILAMMVTLILALLRVYGDLGLPTRYGGPSIFKNHIDTNIMMSLAAFLMGHECITAFEKKNKILSFILLIAMLFSLFYCLGMSSGRTGYAILILLWIVFCLQRLPIKTAIGGIALLALLLSVIMVAPTSSTFQPTLQARLKGLPIELESYHQGGETSIGCRLEYLAQSFKLIQQRPLLGWGAGSFKTTYENVLNTSDKISQHSTNPHNEYLNISVQWGLLGLGGFLWLLWTIFKMSFSLYRPERYVTQGILASFMLGSLVNSLLMDVTSGHLFVVLTATCLGAYPLRKTQSSVSLVPTTNALKKISIIVTTYNWPKALQTVLQALLQQRSQLPFEIIIADDGSTEETAKLIERFKAQASVPLKHVWQPDQGFRAAKIRNQAILAAEGEYIVFLDGDCIPRPNFVQQHARLAEPGFFVVGHRILLNRTFTQQLLAENIDLQKWSIKQWFWAGITGKINRFISLLPIPMGPLRKLSASRWQGAKGCNLGVWKSDLERVNGWEEQFFGWGYEDSDLVIRLLQAKIQRKEGRFAVPVIHLWHPENDRQQERQNWNILKTRLSSRRITSEKGLNQYASFIHLI